MKTFRGFCENINTIRLIDDVVELIVESGSWPENFVDELIESAIKKADNDEHRKILTDIYSEMSLVEDVAGSFGQNMGYGATRGREMLGNAMQSTGSGLGKMWNGMKNAWNSFSSGFKTGNSTEFATDMNKKRIKTLLQQIGNLANTTGLGQDFIQRITDLRNAVDNPSANATATQSGNVNLSQNAPKPRFQLNAGPNGTNYQPMAGPSTTFSPVP